MSLNNWSKSNLLAVTTNFLWLLGNPSLTLLFGSKLYLQPNIGFTLRLVLTVFTLSGITLPKVNRFI